MSGVFERFMAPWGGPQNSKMDGHVSSLVDEKKNKQRNKKASKKERKKMERGKIRETEMGFTVSPPSSSPVSRLLCRTRF